MSTSALTSSQLGAARARLSAKVLGLPIFYKVLIANSMIVVLGAIAGSSVTLAVADYISPAGRVELIAFFAGLGTLLSVAVDFAVLKAAFSPLVQLERTVDEVRNGNLNARAPRAPHADPHIDKLTGTLNDMLDSIDRYRNRMQTLSAEVLLAQEDERKRVARELHDSTGQLLTGLLLRIKSLETSPDPTVQQTAADLLDIASTTLEEVKRTAVELRPPALDDLGLVAALQGYISNYGTTTSIYTDFVARGIGGRLPANVELALYRIVQEALTNTAKHSHATSIHVQLTAQNGWIEVTIQDNGCGFDSDRVFRSRERGLGLFGMRERVGLIGGRLSIESGEGTTLKVHVPLQPSLEAEVL